MKKILLLFLASLLSSCGIQKFNTEYYPFPSNENIEFKVLQVYSSKSVTKGSGNAQVVYYAGKNSVFKQIALKIQNNSNEDKIIDFEDFKLIDSTSREYLVDMVLQAFKLQFVTTKKQFKLKAGKTKTYMVHFAPSFPKKEIIKKLVIKNKLYEIAPSQ